MCCNQTLTGLKWMDGSNLFYFETEELPSISTVAKSKEGKDKNEITFKVTLLEY